MSKPTTINGSISPTYTLTNAYTNMNMSPYITVLNIDQLTSELEHKSNTLSNVNKDLDIIKNLHPSTVEIIKIAEELRFSTNIEDLNKLDTVVRKLLFSSKLEDIINK